MSFSLLTADDILKKSASRNESIRSESSFQAWSEFEAGYPQVILLSTGDSTHDRFLGQHVRDE